MIPFCAPSLRINRFSKEIHTAISGVLSNGQFVLGSEVERFEESFAGYLGVSHCVGVNSGTDALTLALKALGIGRGDEVITVSMSFVATALAILQVGAEPYFVDIDPYTRCMDLDQVEAAINPRTAAVIPVHLHGYPMDMARMMAIADRHKLAVVEDCAQAHGASRDGRAVGSWGHFGAFSFYPTKNLGCIGDGGAIVTRDPSLAAKAGSLRQYGWNEGQRVSSHLGYNSRLDEIQAAVLNVLLPFLEESNIERSQAAHQYHHLLQGMPLELPPMHPGAVYHQFAIAINHRDRLQGYLSMQEAIPTAIHYADPIHTHPLFLRTSAWRLPVTESLATRMLSLPIQPEVVNDRLPEIVAAICRGLK